MNTLKSFAAVIALVLTLSIGGANVYRVGGTPEVYATLSPFDFLAVAYMPRE